jgi:pyruvate/2-oxoglutarate dehydrogenase complex dihydrolipoamide dehydrogenase (E3) component
MRYDAVVVGAGQAGPALAGRLAAAGKSVAVVERHLVGGTCVNTGCMPTKTLVASAHAAHIARRAADFGVMIESPVRIDFARVRARADKVRDDARTNLEEWLGKMDRCTLVRGHARFESAHTLRVGDQRLEAEQIFLNVGGRAIVPSFPGADRVPLLTNSSILALERLPRHLVVVGGGYIGVELGQVFRRLGSQVTIVERGPRLLGHEDADVSDAVREIFEREGIAVRTAAECISFSPAPNRSDVTVHLDCEKGDRDVTGSHVLLAMGRRPNTDDLDVERAGVDRDSRGFIVVDDELRTSAPGIWALGECNGHGAFTHTAYNDFEIVAANLLGTPREPRRRLSDRIPAYAVFLDPPLGRAGLTETEVRRSGRKALIGRRPMSRVGRAVEKAETAGFIKILVDAEGRRLLGASILGTGGDEVIHGLLDIMYAPGGTADTLRRSVGIHPTVSELIPTILGELEPLR